MVAKDNILRHKSQSTTTKVWQRVLGFDFFT